MLLLSLSFPLWTFGGLREGRWRDLNEPDRGLSAEMRALSIRLGANLLIIERAGYLSFRGGRP